MDINLLKLLRDARDVLLFRFYPIDHYRYGVDGSSGRGQCVDAQTDAW